MGHLWIQSFPAAITVCDVNGIILDMNEKALEAFKEDGGETLIGKNLLDCHPEPARSQLAEMLLTQRPKSYTIEKGGVKKLTLEDQLAMLV